MLILSKEDLQASHAGTVTHSRKHKLAHSNQEAGNLSGQTSQTSTTTKQQCKPDGRESSSGPKVIHTARFAQLRNKGSSLAYLTTKHHQPKTIHIPVASEAVTSDTQTSSPTTPLTCDAVKGTSVLLTFLFPFAAAVVGSASIGTGPSLSGPSEASSIFESLAWGKYQNALPGHNTFIANLTLFHTCGSFLSLSCQQTDLT